MPPSDTDMGAAIELNPSRVEAAVPVTNRQVRMIPVFEKSFDGSALLGTRTAHSLLNSSYSELGLLTLCSTPPIRNSDCLEWLRKTVTAVYVTQIYAVLVCAIPCGCAGRHVNYFKFQIVDI